MRVKPTNPTAVIRDPHTRSPLPTEGGKVPDNSFWRRRLAAGEVVLVAEPVAPAKSAAHVKPTPAKHPAAAHAKPTGSEPVAPLTTRDHTRG